MNNAGLPGTGLGGLFYVLLALWMPVAELRATLRGDSSRARWRQVGTQFALACAIVASVVATMVAYLHLADVPSPLGLSGRPLVLAPVVLAAVLLSCLVAVLRVWSRVVSEDVAHERDPDLDLRHVRGRAQRPGDGLRAGGPRRLDHGVGGGAHRR